MSTWLVNDATPKSLGMEMVGGSFRSGAASSVQLRRSSDFDAAELFTGYNGEVTIKRDGVVFFTGTVRAIPKAASDSSEGQDYLVEDAWAALERTVYQEMWSVNGGSVLMPRVFLGVDASGARIDVGAQITEALDFAISAGVGLQVGSIPTGMLLWPTEADAMNCAEVIRTSLRYHPDWIPWIDHTTTPPTFHVTPRASATELTLAATALSDFQVVELQDRLPDCVRIVFVTANESDGVIYRNIQTQKYPTDGPNSGPGVLTTTVDLQGVRASVQKQQIQTRHIPTSLTDSTLSAKEWLKLKYPILSGIADADIEVDDWTREIIAETEDPPDPINPNADRLGGPAETITLADVPGQLVKGSIAEWMRKKVGRVHLTWTLTAGTGASAADAEKIASVPAGTTITATNAVTKIYKGLSSWTPGESAPAGIAEAYYNTIRNGCRFEGQFELHTEDLTGRWHGKKLNLTGGVTAWATMGAPIHSIDWDADTEIATISFGPTPEFAFHDYHEYLKLLRKREVRWISSAERTSDELGDELGASASGDIIGGFDGPETVEDFKNNEAGSLAPFVAKITTAPVMRIRNGILVKTLLPTYATQSITGLDTDQTLAATTKVWIEVTIDTSMATTAAAITIGTDWPDVATFTGTAPDQVQTKATARIGMVASGALPKGTPGFTFKIDGTDYHFLQQLNTNLCMTAVALDGKAVMLPLPWPG